MARISEQVLAGLARPAFAQGMFDLGAAIGNVPGQIQQRRKQEQEMQKFRGMGAVERADFMAGRAKTPEELMQAEAAKTSAVKQSSLESLRGLEAARQAAKTPEEKQRIEQIMSRVAVQAGVDPSTIAGRTQAEQDAVAQRELRQIQLEDKQRQQQEAAISQAYYAVPEKSREKFERNAQQSGFGNVIDELREDRERDQLVNLQLQNAKTQAAENAAMRKAPLPDSELRARINESNIDPELKDQYISELDDIKQPDFEAGETWNPGERKLAEEAMRSLNTAVRNEVAREIARKSAIRTDIRRLEAALTKGPSFRDIEAQKAQAAQDLKTYNPFRQPSEEDIEAKAYDLALVAKKNAIEDVLKQRRFELGEQSIPDEVPEEEEEEEAKEIGGYKVKEIKGS